MWAHRTRRRLVCLTRSFPVESERMSHVGKETRSQNLVKDQYKNLSYTLDEVGIHCHRGLT